MIAILFSSLGISTCSLKMAVALRTNPHILPGWRGHQGADAPQCLTVTDPLTFVSHIDKTPSLPLPNDSRLSITDISQTGIFSCFRRQTDGRGNSCVQFAPLFVSILPWTFSQLRNGCALVLQAHHSFLFFGV
jgi:hypothetical protein